MKEKLGLESLYLCFDCLKSVILVMECAFVYAMCSVKVAMRSIFQTAVNLSCLIAGSLIVSYRF